MKKVTVIGAGASGLAAAARLQSKGFQVDLFEKNPQVGGKMYQIKENGFTFDVGPTIVMMPDIYREVFSDCGKDPDDYINMKKVEPMLTLNFPGEDDLSISTDLVKMTSTLESISEQDTQGYLSYISDIYKRYLVAKNKFLNRAFRSPWDFYNPKSLINGLKLKTFSDAYSSISKFVEDERLRKSLAFQTLYIGISPYSGPSIYTIIPMIELLYGVWFLKGGMHSMAEATAKLFTDLGGNLHLDKSVDEIIMEDRHARGVSVDGEFVSSDYIVCSADFPYAVDSLICDGEHRGKYTSEKIKNMEYSASCFVIYLGLDKKYPVKSLHTIRFANSFDTNVDDIFERYDFPDDPSFYMYVPTFIDESLAPKDHESVYILVPVPELSRTKINWDEENVHKYKNKVLDLVERETLFNDIRDHIVFEDYYTPNEFKDKFNSYNGTAFGLKPTLRQSNYYRPHNKYPYCENLYFCGSSTHPGAGVPIVLNSGKLAAEELIKDDTDRK